ncbi:phage tail tip fiber protein, partial [Providencia rettgeri]|uniref:phage tail tip fiber protein n=1 Tax=Providencia rettgeri TaxID=587 RepID=UPI001BCBF8AF
DETQTKHIETAESRFSDNEALINQLARTIANAESSLAEMGMQLTAEYGNQAVEQLRIKASITRLDTVTANKFQSFAQSIEKLETQFNDVNATITTLKKTVSDNEKSQAEVNELVKSEIGENKAAIEKRAETSVDQQGNSRAYFSIKAGVLHNGQYYDVKMMMSAQVKNGQVVTQIAFAADEFIIFNNANGQFVTPFAVVNGQVFIGSGFIQDGSITNAKIGNVIQSNDFKKGEKGWQIDKNGNPEFNDGTFRGKVYANGGEFNGTVYVEKLIGDNATATVYKEATKDEIHGNRYDQVIETSVIYVGGMPYDIDLLMPTMQFESSCSTSTGIKAAYVQVIIDGVTYTPQTTTIVGDDTSFWNLICSLYVTIPATKKDVKVTVRYTTNHENRCTTKIKPAMIIACKHNSSSFKFS